MWSNRTPQKQFWIRPYTVQSCVFVLLQNHWTLYIKYVEGQWRSWSNRFGNAKADLDSFLEKSCITTRDKWSHCHLRRLYVSCFSIFFFQACVRTFWTICNKFTSCLNSCEYSYIGDGVGSLVFGSRQSVHTLPPLLCTVLSCWHESFFTSITCQMEIKNNCFYTLHLHSLYVCKHGNMYLNWGPWSARSFRTIYSKIQTHCFWLKHFVLKIHPHIL